MICSNGGRRPGPAPPRHHRRSVKVQGGYGRGRVVVEHTPDAIGGELALRRTQSPAACKQRTPSKRERERESAWHDVIDRERLQIIQMLKRSPSFVVSRGGRWWWPQPLCTVHSAYPLSKSVFALTKHSVDLQFVEPLVVRLVAPDLLLRAPVVFVRSVRR